MDVAAFSVAVKSGSSLYSFFFFITLAPDSKSGAKNISSLGLDQKSSYSGCRGYWESKYLEFSASTRKLDQVFTGN